jgi:hypothetical protein
MTMKNVLTSKWFSESRLEIQIIKYFKTLLSNINIVCLMKQEVRYGTVKFGVGKIQL